MNLQLEVYFTTNNKSELLVFSNELFFYGQFERYYDSIIYF